MNNSFVSLLGDSCIYIDMSIFGIPIHQDDLGNPGQDEPVGLFGSAGQDLCLCRQGPLDHISRVGSVHTSMVLHQMGWCAKPIPLVDCISRAYAVLSVQF